MTAMNGEKEAVELRAQLDEMTWYVAELQFVLKGLVAQIMLQQVSATLQEQIAEKLKTGGFVGL
jgi:hypothetical protein